jgi:RNA polymerase sigma factor (sigma-70 family)
LTGIKDGCGTAACGACTVHIDGAAVRSCAFPASSAVGRRITTIEAMNEDGSLDCGAVVLPHLNAAYNLARWLMGSAPEAEDVVQDAVCRALTYLPSFRGTNARAWLLQIVRNAAYASLKQRQRVLFVPIADEPHGDDEQGCAAKELTDPGDDPEAVLAKAQEGKRLDRLLAELPAELRECIILRELEELSYKDIAQITDMPIGTVMSRLWRARRLLVKLAARSDI